MHSFIDEILSCLCMRRTSNDSQYDDDVLQDQPHEKKHYSPQTTDSLAGEILSTLYAADANDEKFAQKLRDVVHETGWYQDLAVAVFTGLEAALKTEAPMGQAMKAACDKATQAVSEVLKFAKEHPIFCGLVAVGILVALSLPWMIELLGFGELGPIEGSFAALWQSRYAGYVPKDSWFAFFQRLGMVWNRSSLRVRLGGISDPLGSNI